MFAFLQVIKILEKQEVHPSIVKVMCALHSSHVETLVWEKWVPTPGANFIRDIDVVLCERLSLQAGKINVTWFEQCEDKLVSGGWPRSQRLLLAMLKWPSAYPEAQRRLREIKAGRKPFTWIGEPQDVRGGRARRGPYAR
jgi:hypothetical protein